MKGCFTTLLLALIAAFIAAFFGRSCHRQGVEDILTQRVASEITAAYPGVEVKYDHLTAIVTGTASDSEIEEIRTKIKDLSLGNGRVFVDLSDLPYFSIVRNGGAIVLEGSVDSRQTKDALAQAAVRVQPNLAVVNQIEIGEKVASYPDLENFVQAIPLLFRQAENAKVEANPDRVVVSGMVANESVKSELLGLYASSKLGGAEIVDKITIKPPPPRTDPANFTITRNNNKLTITGTVDSPATKAKIGSIAAADGLTVDNQLKISNTTKQVPALDATLAGIPSLISSAQNGKIEVNADQITLTGLVPNRAAKDSIAGFYSGPQWSGPQIVNRIQVKPSLPAQFVIQRNNDKLVLTGRVDSQRSKNMLGNAAKLPGVSVDNQIQVNEEVMAFPEFNAALAGIPSLLSSAANGKIEVDPKKVTLSGLVDNKAGKDSVMGFFSGAKWKGPQIIDQIRIKPNLPPSFAVERNNEKVTLTGMVDKPATKTRLGNAAKLDGLTVDNQIKISDEVMAFPEFDSAVSSIPVFVGATREGKIEMTPEKVSMTGGVTDADAKLRLENFFAGVNWKGPKFTNPINISMLASKLPGFSISRDKNKVTLTGTVDSPEAKTALGNAAKIPGVEVENQIKVSDDVTAFAAMDQTVKGVPALVKAAENGSIAVDPEKVVLSGMVNNKGDKDSVLGHFSAENWQGPKIVDQIKIKPKMVAPTFVWSQENPKKVVLTGKVPTSKVRDTIVASAKKRIGNDGEVVDKLEVNANVSNEPWLEALPVFADQSLGKVTIPNIAIEKGKASITGKVANSTVMNDVSLAFSGINPPGKLDVKLDVDKPMAPDPKPMPSRTVVPDVEVTGTGDKLTVAGKVPNQKTHDKIVNAILEKEDIDLSRKLKIADDVKEENYLDHLPEFIGKFYNGSVKERELWLRNKELTLRGVLPSKKAKEQTVAMADPLKERGVKIIDLMTVKAPVEMAVVEPKPKDPVPAPPMKEEPPKQPMEQAKPAAIKPAPTVTKKADEMKGAPPVNKEGELHSVYFGTGEFHIRDSQKPRANKLLARAKETTGQIYIDGYADERGPQYTNAFLSDQRARRIRSFLIQNGIDENRIVSVAGRGEVPNGKYREYRRTDVRIVESK